MYCQIGNFSDKGQVRAENEDYFGCYDTPNGRIVVVCDGMGGHVGGAIASRTAVEAIKNFLMANSFEDPFQALSQSITAANNAVLRYAEQNPELSGMGSTCVAVLIKDKKAYYAHVGDSRIYMVSHHKIKQLTTDHSFVQMLVDAGQISKEDAEHHPRKNEITNALGLRSMKPATLGQMPIVGTKGDCFILCTDGLTNMVDDSTIEKVVSNRNIDINQRAMRLVELANKAGGLDNITVQLIEFTEGNPGLPSGIQQAKVSKGNSKNKTIIIISVLALLLIGGSVAFYMHKKPKEKKTEETTTEAVQNTPSGQQQAPDNKEKKDIHSTPVTLSIGKETAIPIIIGENATCKVIEPHEGVQAHMDHNTIFITASRIDFQEIKLLCETDKNIFEVTIPIKKEENKLLAKQEPISDVTLAVAEVQIGVEKQIPYKPVAEINSYTQEDREKATATLANNLIYLTVKDKSVNSIKLNIETEKGNYKLTIPIKVKEEAGSN